ILPEPSQDLARRSSLNIWHDVVVKISCKDEGLLLTVGAVTRNRFPSLKIWQDNKPKLEFPQGAFSDLWQPDPKGSLLRSAMSKATLSEPRIVLVLVIAMTSTSCGNQMSDYINTVRSGLTGSRCR